MKRPYTKEEYEKYRRAQEEIEAKKKKERTERMEKESARRLWIADGGDENSFEKAWPELQSEARRQRVIAAARRARQVMRASGVSKL